MNNNSMIFIGLDTHKNYDQVAYCEDERLSKPNHQGLGWAKGLGPKPFILCHTYLHPFPSQQRNLQSPFAKALA